MINLELQAMLNELADLNALQGEGQTFTVKLSPDTAAHLALMSEEYPHLNKQQIMRVVVHFGLHAYEEHVRGAKSKRGQPCLI